MRIEHLKDLKKKEKKRAIPLTTPTLKSPLFCFRRIFFRYNSFLRVCLILFVCERKLVVSFYRFALNRIRSFSWVRRSFLSNTILSGCCLLDDKSNSFALQKETRKLTIGQWQRKRKNYWAMTKQSWKNSSVHTPTCFISSMSLAHHIWSSPIGWSWPMSLEFEEVDSEEWQISIWEDNTDQISWRTNGIPFRLKFMHVFLLKMHLVEIEKNGKNESMWLIHDSSVENILKRNWKWLENNHSTLRINT